MLTQHRCGAQALIRHRSNTWPEETRNALNQALTLAHALPGPLEGFKPAKCRPPATSVHACAGMVDPHKQARSQPAVTTPLSADRLPGLAFASTLWYCPFTPLAAATVIRLCLGLLVPQGHPNLVRGLHLSSAPAYELPPDLRLSPLKLPIALGPPWIALGSRADSTLLSSYKGRLTARPVPDLQHLSGSPDVLLTKAESALPNNSTSCPSLA